MKHNGSQDFEMSSLLFICGPVAKSLSLPLFLPLSSPPLSSSLLSSLMFHTLCRASVWPEQLPVQGFYKVVCHCLPRISLGKNLQFARSAGDRSPTLCEEHCVIFQVHQLMLADGTPSLTSIWGTAHTMKHDPACKTPRWQLITGSAFEPRI